MIIPEREKEEHIAKGTTNRTGNASKGGERVVQEEKKVTKKLSETLVAASTADGPGGQNTGNVRSRADREQGYTVPRSLY